MRMLRRSTRPDDFRWKPAPPVPTQFVKRFPEMAPYFDQLTTIFQENESAVRRALEAIQDPTVTTEQLTQLEVRVREIAQEVVSGAGDTIINNIEQKVIDIINEQPPPPSGGGGGRLRSYLHLQPIPDTVWDVNHNLGQFPDVLPMDPSGLKFVCDILYLDTNRLKMIHTIPMSGSALCTI